MRSIVRVCALLAGWVLLSAFASRSAHAQSAVLVDAGREEYRHYCASCHGTDGKGDGPLAAVLRIPPPDLTRLAKQNGGSFQGAKIAAAIDGRFTVAAHGTGTMPVWGRVLGERIGDAASAEEVGRGQIEAIVSYLQSIQR
jgi:mono/diheme cytochrome c family protein